MSDYDDYDDDYEQYVSDLQASSPQSTPVTREEYARTRQAVGYTGSLLRAWLDNNDTTRFTDILEDITHLQPQQIVDILEETVRAAATPNNRELLSLLGLWKRTPPRPATDDQTPIDVNDPNDPKYAKYLATRMRSPIRHRILALRLELAYLAQLDETPLVVVDGALVENPDAQAKAEDHRDQAWADIANEVDISSQGCCQFPTDCWGHIAAELANDAAGYKALALGEAEAIAEVQRELADKLDYANKHGGTDPCEWR